MSPSSKANEESLIALIKCPRCDFRHVADYREERTKDVAFAWANRLHKKAHPKCPHVFGKVTYIPIPGDMDPHAFAREKAR
jgi:hypothetical protein